MLVLRFRVDRKHFENDGVTITNVFSNVSISSDSVYDSVAHDLVKTRLSGWKQKRKNQPIIRP